MANVSNSSGVFTGISELHVVKGGFEDSFTLAEGASLVEIPVAEDSGFSYTGGTPSVERYRIHGLSTPWSSKMTPGDAETNLFVPQITSALLTLFGFTSSAANSVSLLNKTWNGIKFNDAPKEVYLGIAAINRTADQLFAIKKVKVLASIVFDDANSAKPIGFQLTGTSLSSEADAMGIFEVVTDVYEVVTNPSGNPSTKGYYELVDGQYVPSTDTSVDSGKTYYQKKSS